MPRRAKGPRLWLRPARRDDTGQITHEPAWFILDGPIQRGTGLGLGATADEKEAALSDYLDQKHVDVRSSGIKDPSQIEVNDVLILYGKDKIPKHSDPDKTKSRIGFLHAFWSGKMLSEVTGKTCRDYAATRPEQAARRELEDLRAAIIYHRKEGLHDRIVSVVLPDKSPPRERWLTREEAALLIRSAWRHVADWGGNGASKYSRRHVARFMILARYMGSRASVLAAASIEPKRPSKGPWIDLRMGTFHGRGIGERVTSKRKQQTAVPPPLLGHLRRWAKNGQRFAVEFNGEAVASVKKGHAQVVEDCGLENVTQHTWRHTVATWLMQGNADIHEAANFLAIDVKTLLRVYGHHRPTHAAGIHKAFHAQRIRLKG
ncbi:site-specific integrase [Bradyrhizobium liaoningense]